MRRSKNNMFSLVYKSLKVVYKIDRNKFIGLGGITLAISIIPTISIYTMQNMINAVIEPNTSVTLLQTLFSLYVLLLASNFVLTTISGFINNLYSQNISNELSMNVLKKSGELDLIEFEDSTEQNKIRRALQNVTTIPASILTTTLTFLNGLITLGASVIYIMSWKKEIGFLLLFLPFVFFFFYNRISKFNYNIDLAQTERRKYKWYFSHLLTQDSTFKESKVNKFNVYLLEKYQKYNNEFYRESKTSFWYSFKYLSIIEVVNIIVICFVFYLLFLDIMVGSILIGSFVSITQIVNQAYNSSKSLSTTTHTLLQKKLYLIEIFDVLERKSIQKQKEVSNEITIDTIKMIEFSNVSFKYPNSSQYALDNISFIININEKVCIVGRNGSGKSTLLKLLIGLYTPTKGKILINGINIKDLDLDTYYKKISVLFQDFGKYELSVRENVSLSKIDMIDDSTIIINNLEKVGLKEKFNQYEENINQNLGTWFSDSVSLSGGEWQKVGLARTFFKPSDVLILDEGNSDLDSISQDTLYHSFEKETKGRIGITVTHKYYRIDTFDKILLLDKGLLVGNDNYEKMIKSNALFIELFNKSLDV